MTKESNAITDAAEALPSVDHFALLTFSALPPEVFKGLNEEQIKEWTRAYWAQRGVK